jgi:hypothetical protein
MPGVATLALLFMAATSTVYSLPKDVGSLQKDPEAVFNATVLEKMLTLNRSPSFPDIKYCMVGGWLDGTGYTRLAIPSEMFDSHKVSDGIYQIKFSESLLETPICSVTQYYEESTLGNAVIKGASPQEFTYIMTDGKGNATDRDSMFTCLITQSS